MATTGLEVFDKTLHTTNLWLDEISAEIGPDRHLAWHVLGAVLRSIRDEMLVEQSAHFAAQLPLLVRGAYFDQYRPAAQPVSVRSQEQFIARIHHELAGSRPVSPEAAATAVMRTLNRHVTEGQVRKVRDSLPKGVRALWPEPGQTAKGEAAGPRPQEAAPGGPKRDVTEGSRGDGERALEPAEASSIAQSAPGFPNDSSRPVEIDAATTKAVERAMGLREGARGGPKTRPKRKGE